MTEQRFISLREASWNSFEALRKAPKKEFRREAARFPELLRALTGDLNTARANGFNPAIVERLNRLAFDGNQVLSSVRRFSLKETAVFFARSIPQSLRAHWRSFAFCALIFYGIAFFVAALCINKPYFSASILGREQEVRLESMYDKNSSYYLKPREITTDADMFGFYIYNNVSITFYTFAGGVFAGVGALFFLAANALFLGASSAFIINKGMGETFFSFVCGHSSFELTGLIMGAQAGFILGRSLFLTKNISRQASFRAAGKSAFPILAGAAFFDFIAAIIEAFWSSKHQISANVHYIFAAAAWIILASYLLFCGRSKSA